MPPTRIHHHAPPVSLHEKGLMPMSTVQTLVDSGIHFGQRRTNWNPKMARFIFGERNKIHIIDIRETLKGLLLANASSSKSWPRQGCLLCGHWRRKDSIASMHRGRHALRNEAVGGITIAHS